MKQFRLLIPVKIGWNLYCHLEVTEVYYKNKGKNAHSGCKVPGILWFFPLQTN